MKNYNFIFLFILIHVGLQIKGQNKNFIDQPFLETIVEVDTLVKPDKIHLIINLNEKDNKNRISTEQMEASMLKILKALNININKNLSLLDYSSNFKKHFLSSTKVLKTKMYALTLRNAQIVGKVMAALERVKISNISIIKTEYLKSDLLLQELKTKAIIKAKQTATKMLHPLNQKIGKAIYISDIDTKSSKDRYQAKMNTIKIRGYSSVYGARSSEDMIIDFQKMKFSAKVKVKFIIQ